MIKHLIQPFRGSEMLFGGTDGVWTVTTYLEKGHAFIVLVRSRRSWYDESP